MCVYSILGTYYYYYVLWSGRAPPRDPNSQPLISPPLSTSLLLYYHNTATTLQLFFFSSLLFFLFFFSLLRASSCLSITPDFHLSIFPLLLLVPLLLPPSLSASYPQPTFFCLFSFLSIQFNYLCYCVSSLVVSSILLLSLTLTFHPNIPARPSSRRCV